MSYKHTHEQRLNALVRNLVNNIARIPHKARCDEYLGLTSKVAAASRSIFSALKNSSQPDLGYLHAGQLMACAHRLLAPLGRPSSSSQVTSAQVQLAQDFIKAGLLQAMNELVLQLQIGPDPSSPAWHRKVQFLGCGPDALAPAASTARRTATVREASSELLAQLVDLIVRITVWVEVACQLDPSPTTAKEIAPSPMQTSLISSQAAAAPSPSPATPAQTLGAQEPVHPAALSLELRRQLMTPSPGDDLVVATGLSMCSPTGPHQRERVGCVCHIVLSTALELAPTLLKDTRGREGLLQPLGMMASLSLSKHLSALLRTDMGTLDPQAIELSLRTTTWLDRAGPATRMTLVSKKLTDLRTQAAMAGLLLFAEGSEALTPATCCMAAACLHDLTHNLQRTPDDGVDKVAPLAGVMLGVVSKLRQAQSDPQLAAALRPAPGQPSAVVAALLVAALLVGWDCKRTRNKMDTPRAPLFPTPSAAVEYLETLLALLTEEMRGLVAQHRQWSSQQVRVQTEVGNNTSSGSGGDRRGGGSGAGAAWQAGCGQAAVDAAASISAASELVLALMGADSAQVVMRLGGAAARHTQEQEQAFSKQLQLEVLSLAGAAADVWATPWAGGTAAGSEAWLQAMQAFDVVECMSKVPMTHVRLYAELLSCCPLSLPVAAAAVITRLHRCLGPRTRRNPCAASCAGPEMESCMRIHIDLMLAMAHIMDPTSLALTPWCPMADTETDVKWLVRQSMQAACRDEAYEGAQFRGQFCMSLMMHGVRWGPAAAQAVRVVLGIAAQEGMEVEVGVDVPAVCGVLLGLPLTLPTVLKATLLECRGVVGAEAFREARAWLREKLVGVVGSCQAAASDAGIARAADQGGAGKGCGGRGAGGKAGGGQGGRQHMRTGGVRPMAVWQAVALAHDEVLKAGRGGSMQNRIAAVGGSGDGGPQPGDPPCSLHITDCLTLLADLAPPPAPGCAPAAAAAGSAARPRQSVAAMHAWAESALVLGVQAWSVGACRGLVAQLGEECGVPQGLLG